MQQTGNHRWFKQQRCCNVTATVDGRWNQRHWQLNINFSRNNSNCICLDLAYQWSKKKKGNYALNYVGIWRQIGNLNSYKVSTVGKCILASLKNWLCRWKLGAVFVCVTVYNIHNCISPYSIVFRWGGNSALTSFTSFLLVQFDS